MKQIIVDFSSEHCESNITLSETDRYVSMVFREKGKFQGHVFLYEENTKELIKALNIVLKQFKKEKP